MPHPKFFPRGLLSLVLFALGTLGVFLRRNVITVLMSIELMLNGANLAFVAFSIIDTSVRAFSTLPAALVRLSIRSASAASNRALKRCCASITFS